MSELPFFASTVVPKVVTEDVWKTTAKICPQNIARTLLFCFLQVYVRQSSWAILLGPDFDSLFPRALSALSTSVDTFSNVDLFWSS